MDTGNNGTDFVTGAPAPKNSASPADDTGAPDFTSLATASLNENATSVMAVAASDTEGNALAYSILLPSGTNGAGADGASFSIDPATGALSFIAAPDFENGTGSGSNANEYLVTVRVTDSGGSARNQLVTVTVNDIASPIVTSGGAVTVTENAPATNIIYTAAAIVDVGDTVNWSLTGTDAQLLSIDVNTGEVTLNASPDFEAKSSYSFSVVATVNGSPSLTSTKAVTVNVTDVNDNAPTDIGLSNASIREFAATGTEVGTLSATDADSSNTFTYQLENADPRFAISGSKLVVASGQLLDFEQAASHDVVIRVFDGSGASFSKTFTIQVQDVNPEVVVAALTTVQLVGGAGNDDFTGRGTTILKGGLGNDIYRTTGGDQIFENFNQGYDTVYSSANHTLSANVEALVLTGTAVGVTGTGNALSNVIYGSTNTQANVLEGARRKRHLYRWDGGHGCRGAERRHR